MIPANLSAMWRAIAPALGNHLWQSTLFAVAAGLLALTLRKNQARARYWVWLAASVKFLIPFSLLVEIGSQVAWSHGSAGMKAGVVVAMEQVSQPFTQAVTVIPQIPGAATPTVLQSLWHLLPVVVEERERACDEEVVAMGRERRVYAESILKVCEFCVESPLACVSGVTGSDLKKRMVHIMTERIARKLDFGRKLLLSTAVLLALVIPIGFGVANATPRRAPAENAEASAAAYKSASIRPHQAVNGVQEHVGIMFSPTGFTARGANARLGQLRKVRY